MEVGVWAFYQFVRYNVIEQTPYFSINSKAREGSKLLISTPGVPIFYETAVTVA
jgi:hypothetical protein